MLINFIKPDFVHSDERGTLIQLVREGYKQVNVITCAKDTLRGGHYHKHNTEAFYVVSGSFKLVLELDGIIEEYNIGKNTFFSVAPYVKHSFIYSEETLLVSMYSNGVEMSDGAKDIWTF